MRLLLLLFVIAALILVAGDVVGIVLFAVAIAIMFKWSKGVFTASAVFTAINTKVCYLNLFPSSLLIFTIYLPYIAVVSAAGAVWFYLST